MGLLRRTALRRVPVTPIGAPPSYTPYRSDDFTSYADNTAFRAEVGNLASGKRYEFMSAGGSCTLDSSVLFNGHPTARFRIWDAGGTETPIFRINMHTITDGWFRWVTRWTPGFCNAIGNGYSGGLSHKQFNLGFAGVYGRLLGAVSAGTGTPGGSNNNGDYVVETVSQTGDPTTYIVPSLRSIIEGASKMYNDGEWYEMIIRWTRVSANETRAHIWHQKFGDPRTLMLTMRCQNFDHTGTSGVSSLTIPDNFNAFDAGPPVGVDQSINIGEWEIIEEDGSVDPFGLGLTVGTDVSLTGSLSANNAITVAQGGSDTRTLNLVRGAALSTITLYVQSVQNRPTGLTVTPASATLAHPTTSTVLTVATTGSTPPGVYNLNIQVITGAEGHSAGNKGVGAVVASIPFTVTVT